LNTKIIIFYLKGHLDLVKCCTQDAVFDYKLMMQMAMESKDSGITGIPRVVMTMKLRLAHKM